MFLFLWECISLFVGRCFICTLVSSYHCYHLEHYQNGFAGFFFNVKLFGSMTFLKALHLFYDYYFHYFWTAFQDSLVIPKTHFWISSFKATPQLWRNPKKKVLWKLAGPSFAVGSTRGSPWHCLLEGGGVLQVIAFSNGIIFILLCLWGKKNMSERGSRKDVPVKRSLNDAD